MQISCDIYLSREAKMSNDVLQFCNKLSAFWNPHCIKQSLFTCNRDKNIRKQTEVSEITNIKTNRSNYQFKSPTIHFRIRDNCLISCLTHQSYHNKPYAPPPQKEIEVQKTQVIAMLLQTLVQVPTWICFPPPSLKAVTMSEIQCDPLMRITKVQLKITVQMQQAQS